jgi:hypothetical protein
VLEDVQITPTTRKGNAPLFAEATLTDGSKTLVLRAALDVHQIEERITLDGPGRVHFLVRDRLKTSPVTIERLMSHFYFVPDGRALGHALPMDFAWLSNLHSRPEQVVGDRFFRSPAAIVVARGLYAAIVPDLNLLAEHREVPHALDLRSFGHPGAGCYGLPRLSYGLCPWKLEGHVYTAPAGAATISAKELSYAFDLFLGEAEGAEVPVQRTVHWLWDQYGRNHLADIRPQVLPFEEYGRKYAYVHELKQTAAKAILDGKECWGINNGGRHGANFHAWENDLDVGFGLWHYAQKWNDEGLRRIARGMMQLSLAAPRKAGAFPCIYNFQAKAWEGSLWWTAEPAWAREGYDTQSMAVSAWWQVYWLEHFKEVKQSAEIRRRVAELAEFLARAQLPSGAIPTYYDSQLRPGGQLKESATTAICGAVLAKTAGLTGDEKLKQAALAAGRFMEREILPKTLFQDFEVFYSCAPKPLYWADAVNGIPPVNTLAIQWSADQFLALYRLTGDPHWLRRGEYCLSLLSFFQAVWTPPWMDAYLFGGASSQNTDGEWGDLRVQRWVSTYADYYEATGSMEYLERAVAACRASFANMDIEENHVNKINNLRPIAVPPGQGYSSETIFHEGTSPNWCHTGFDWGPGGALAASAYLELHFGSVWIDGHTRQAVPIDGVAAKIISWDADRIVLDVRSALTALGYDDKGRHLRVKFGALPEKQYAVIINGKSYGTVDRDRLRAGLSVELSQVPNPQ